jgi:hypothetical protein
MDMASHYKVVVEVSDEGKFSTSEEISGTGMETGVGDAMKLAALKVIMNSQSWWEKKSFLHTIKVD